MIRVALDPLEYALPSTISDRVRATAIGAARRAGAIQMDQFRNPEVRCTRLLYDVKLETDRQCENAILAEIRNAFPDHSILTEESGEFPGTGACIWIIDPLDGTVNFWHGLPFFCVSIACYRNGSRASAASGTHAGLPGEPIIGVVFLPCTQELFVGMPGRGASLNGRPIRVSSDCAGDAVVAVSFGKTPEVMRRMTRRLDVLMPQVRKARCLGAAAAELAYVSAGFLGGLIYEGIKLWDFAAGKIILEEAGGFLEAAETEPDQWRVIGGAPALRDALAKHFD